jgi:ABC-type Na+ efflux pump permease subunit
LVKIINSILFSQIRTGKFMSGKLAGYIILVISIVLAVLLLTKTINFIICESIFVLSLVILGVASKGFKNKPAAKG